MFNHFAFALYYCHCTVVHNFTCRFVKFSFWWRITFQLFRVDDWILMNSPLPTLLICAIYVFMVIRLFMKFNNTGNPRYPSWLVTVKIELRKWLKLTTSYHSICFVFSDGYRNLGKNLAATYIKVIISRTSLYMIFWGYFTIFLFLFPWITWYPSFFDGCWGLK